MKTLIVVFLFIIAIPLIGCFGETNYQFGDLSKKYCSSTDPQLRELARGIAASKGITLVAYCEMLGLEYTPDEEPAIIKPEE